MSDIKTNVPTGPATNLALTSIVEGESVCVSVEDGKIKIKSTGCDGDIVLEMMDKEKMVLVAISQ